MLKKLIPTCVLLCWGSGVQAQVVFTEIMYDVAGRDDGNEWVEVYNQGESDVDVTTLRFVEGGVNHKITEMSTAVLRAHEYAIIADNATAFSSLYPSFTGLLFDSSFSLANTGEALSLKNDEVSIDMVTYTPNEGANGTGASLQKINTSWVVAAANPGYGSSLSDPLVEVASTTQVAAQLSSIVVGGEPPADPVVPRVKVSMNTDTVITAGTPARFEGLASIGGVSAPDTARFLWNFGDGAVFVGRNTTHTYAVPGHYVVSLTVSTGGTSETHMVSLDVLAASVSIVAVSFGVDGSITLKNNGTKILNISTWYARTTDDTFVFPVGTYLAPGVAVPFPNKTTRLLLKGNEHVFLHMPNGSVIGQSDGMFSAQATTTLVSNTVYVADDGGRGYTPSSAQKSISSAPGSGHVLVATSTAGALVHESIPASSDSKVWWYVVFVGVLAVASYGTLLFEKKRLVDEFEIIEAHDES